MKYWSHFVAVMKMKMRRELEQNYRCSHVFKKNAESSFFSPGEWDQAHVHVNGGRRKWATTGTQWALRVSDDVATTKQTAQKAAEVFKTRRCPAFLARGLLVHKRSSSHPVKSCSHTSAAAVNLCLKSRQIIIHVLARVFPHFSPASLSHSHSRWWGEGSHDEELLKNPLNSAPAQTAARSLGSSSARCSETLGQTLLINTQLLSARALQQLRGGQCTSIPSMSLCTAGNLHLFTSATHNQATVIRSTSIVTFNQDYLSPWFSTPGFRPNLWALLSQQSCWTRTEHILGLVFVVPNITWTVLDPLWVWCHAAYLLSNVTALNFTQSPLTKLDPQEVSPALVQANTFCGTRS